MTRVVWRPLLSIVTSKLGPLSSFASMKSTSRQPGRSLATSASISSLVMALPSHRPVDNAGRTAGLSGGGFPPNPLARSPPGRGSVGDAVELRCHDEVVLVQALDLFG